MSYEETVQQNEDVSIDTSDFANAVSPTGEYGDDFPLSALTENLSNEAFLAIQKIFKENTNIDKETRELILESFRSALSSQFFDDTYQRLVDAANRDWKQVVEVDGNKLRIMKRSAAKPTGGKKLQGQAAIDFMNSQINGTGSVKVPLWNSGITVLLGNFKELEYMEVIAKIALSRMELGASTRGALFSGDDVYITMEVVDFILSKVMASTLKDSSKSNLKEHILVSDIPTLLAGALSALNPKGYPINHTCVNVAKGECTYGTKIEEKDGKYKQYGMVDFKKLLWVDRGRVSKELGRLVNASWESVSNEEVKKMQASLLPDQIIGPLESDAGLFKIVGQHPNLADYQRLSTEWINEVINAVNRVMVTADDATERERIETRVREIETFQETIGRRRNIAWIKEIIMEIPDEDESIVMEGEEAIAGILDQQLGTLYAEEIDEGIRDYKDACTISVVGLPNFECPVCHSSQTDSSRYPSLIPLNLITYFFNIGEWKRMTTQQRAGIYR